ncbi:MAG: hypothetical protein ACJARP_001892 [Vicingaceae bacterium]|jgi:hypothetical protein
MENSRLSLADFKEKAEKVNSNEVLETIQGGELEWCHGYWGQKAKEYAEHLNEWGETIFGD